MSEASSSVAQVCHDGGHLRNRLLAPKLPPRTRRRRRRLGHVRKPFIPVVAQEYDALQELAKAHRKREPCGEGPDFQSRGLQNLTKRHARQQRIGRLPNTGRAKKVHTPGTYRSAVLTIKSRSDAHFHSPISISSAGYKKRFQSPNSPSTTGTKNEVALAAYGTCSARATQAAFAGGQ